jgi:hypothetical protein
MKKETGSLILCYDIGGTKIAAALFDAAPDSSSDPSANLLAYSTTLTRAEEGAEPIFERLKKLGDSLLVRQTLIFRIKEQGLATACKSSGYKVTTLAVNRTKTPKTRWLGPQFGPHPEIHYLCRECHGPQFGPQSIFHIERIHATRKLYSS